MVDGWGVLVETKAAPVAVLYVTVGVSKKKKTSTTPRIRSDSKGRTQWNRDKDLNHVQDECDMIRGKKKRSKRRVSTSLGLRMVEMLEWILLSVVRPLLIPR